MHSIKALIVLIYASTSLICVAPNYEACAVYVCFNKTMIYVFDFLYFYKPFYVVLQV